MYSREEIESWLVTIGFAKIYPNKDCWGYRAKDAETCVHFDEGRVKIEMEHEDGIVISFSTMYPTKRVIEHAWVTLDVAMKVAVENNVEPVS